HLGGRDLHYLLNCQFGRLHRHCAQPCTTLSKGAPTNESFGKLGTDTGNVVVQHHRQVQRVLWLGPVREHHWDSGEHLKQCCLLKTPLTWTLTPKLSISLILGLAR